MLPVSIFVQSPPYFIREPEPLRKEFAGQKAERFEVTGFKHTDMFLEVLRREETIGALAPLLSPLFQGERRGSIAPCSFHIRRS